MFAVVRTTESTDSPNGRLLPCPGVHMNGSWDGPRDVEPNEFQWPCRDRGFVCPCYVDVNVASPVPVPVPVPMTVFVLTPLNVACPSERGCFTRTCTVGCCFWCPRSVASVRALNALGCRAWAWDVTRLPRDLKRAWENVPARLPKASSCHAFLSSWSLRPSLRTLSIVSTLVVRLQTHGPLGT